MEARVKWVENAAFMAETGSGHAMVIDGPADIGGRNLGPRPMEMMLVSVGSCSAVDIVHILKKARQPVSGCEVAVFYKTGTGTRRIVRAVRNSKKALPCNSATPFSMCQTCPQHSSFMALRLA